MATAALLTAGSACSSDAPSTPPPTGGGTDGEVVETDAGPTQGATDATVDAMQTPVSLEPEGWDKGLRVPRASDENPDPDIVEIMLEASPSTWDYGSGVETDVYAFNGSIPGPLIEGEIGDTLIVHFTNNLPEPTTVHWHGLELPATEDGSLISQPPVEPGQTRTYQYELTRASTYWYHPHIQSHVQIEKGLYAPLVVRDPAEQDTLGLPQDELILVFDDVLLDENKQVEPAFPEDPLALASRSLNGRFGNVLLVNGHPLPDEPIPVRSGVPVRVRIINAANSRFFRLSMKDANLYQIGVDGGLLQHPRPVPPIDTVPHSVFETMFGLPPSGSDAPISNPDPSLGVTLVPGQRADLVFTPVGEVGTQLIVESHDMHRGRHGVTSGPEGIEIVHTHADGEGDPMELMRFEIVEGGDPQAVPYEPPETLREIERLDVTGAEKLPVMFGHTMPNLEGEITMFATMDEGAGVPFDQLTAEQALQAKVGETYIYEVVNMTGGDHPFHPHGFFFQPLEIEYIDEENPERNRVVPFETLQDRDTIRVPARLGKKGTSRTILRAAVRFDDAGRQGLVEAYGKTPTPTRSGGWLVHCHVLEHAKLGMMTFVNLRE